MTIQEAIKKSIEGGYTKNLNVEILMKLPEYAKHQIWNDPHFWQALGKAMRWDEKGGLIYQHTWIGSKENKIYLKGKESMKVWLYEWHKFIDHLAEGKSIEEYFKELK